MEKSIARKILLIAIIALVIFAFAIFFVLDNMNKKSAEDNSVKLLSVIEKQMINGGYTTEEQYKEIVKISVEDVRITVISLDGTVLADSMMEDVSSMENHLGRKEIKAALEGKTSSAIRKSNTFNINYIYTAKKVSVNETEVLLRVAVPLSSINGYLSGILIAILIILVILLFLIFIISSFIAENLNKPLKLIKEKLDTVGNSYETKHIQLTKFDEVNTVLMEIDELSEKINSNLKKYLSEKQKLDFIIENTNQGLIALGKGLEIISYNNIAAEYLGAELLLNEKINVLIRDISFNENLNKCANTGEYTNFYMDFESGMILEIKFIPVKESEVLVIIVINDITDSKKLSLEKQEFFVNASHELNTPLSSILGYSEMMLSSNKLERKFLETINKEAERMKNLISDMLQISELENVKNIEDSKINIKKIAEEVLVSYQPKAAAKNIELKTQLKNGFIFANSEKITKLISNLVDNSIKYNNQGGFVEVVTETKNNEVILTVKDNGIGIPKKDLSRVFERFYRVDKNRSKAESGTGLGLSIVKHVAKNYNAPVKLVSKENEGTHITVIFKNFES